MSQPVPEISVPNATDRFNVPTGNGFFRWFAALRASIGVALIEVRNQAVASANATSRLYTDETMEKAVSAGINLAERVENLEAIGGLAPGDVTDATMAQVAANPASAFSSGFTAAYGLAEPALQRLDALAATDRTASLARSRVEYEDNAGWTDDFSNMVGWEATAVSTGGYVHNGPTGPGAQRILLGLETTPSRVIGTIEVVATGGGVGGGLTLFGLTRNASSDVGQMIPNGFFGIGVTEANLPTSYPGGDLSTTPLEPGTYSVSAFTTGVEIICTLHSNTGERYYRYSYPISGWGASQKIALFNSDSRNAGGNLLGPVSARTGYVTAKPRGRAESRLRWANYGVPPRFAERALIGTPANYDARKPLPWVIYAHGYGDTAENSMNQMLAIQPVLNALINAGYGVAASDFGGTANWGNPGSIQTMDELYRHLRDAYNVGPIVLMGHSMGGLVTLSALANRTVPGIAGWVGVEPVVSLAGMYNHATVAEYRTTISNAYGIAADGSNYAAKTSGYDPALRKASDFRGVPMLMFASPADTAVVKTQNSDVLQAKVQPLQPDVTVVQATGGHVDPSHFQPDVVVAFANRVTAA